MNTIRIVALTVLGSVLVAHPGSSQDRPEDRRRFLDPGTVLSNDPRWVPIAPVPQGPAGTIVLRGGRVFDGTGTPAREATVVIERNRIKAILAPGAAPTWPNDARIVDVTGKTVLPGLIDLHTHLTYPGSTTGPAQYADDADAALRGAERMRYYIESGITSVRDVASHGDVPFRLKEWSATNRIPGPRVFAAGQIITATGGHGAEGLGPTSPLWRAVREASGADDWREAVRSLFKRGADVIKIGSHFTVDEARAAVEEAHALGIKVTCDCETFYVDRAIQAGVDMIEHPLPRTDAAIRLMAERKIESDPTMVIVQLVWDAAGGYYGSTSRRFTWDPASTRETVKKLKAAGIKLGVGTDLVSDFFRLLPEPYVRELEYFTQVGYSVPEALVAATKTSAEMLNVGEKLGTLEPGKLADVVVVNGRPDVTLRDLTKMDLVIRDGLVVVEGGRAVVPARVAIPWPTSGRKP